jgi:RNA polymerase sigma-70 factor (ECF subfamily)
MNTATTVLTTAPSGIERSLSADERYESYAGLVSQIQRGEIDGMEELYKIFGNGVRCYHRRYLSPEETEDKIHDAFLMVAHSILEGQLREPCRLMSFVWTVVERQRIAYIKTMVRKRTVFEDLRTEFMIDGKENPEQAAIKRQRAGAIDQVMEELSERDREILTRFYLHEQTSTQICADMGLSETQFRLTKSRAKARFAEIGQRRFVRSGRGALTRLCSRSYDLRGRTMKP